MLSLLNSLRKQKKKVFYVYDQPLILYLNNLQFALFQGFIFSMQFNIYELVARIGFLIIISKYSQYIRGDLVWKAQKHLGNAHLRRF